MADGSCVRFAMLSRPDISAAIAAAVGEKHSLEIRSGSAASAAKGSGDAIINSNLQVCEHEEQIMNTGSAGDNNSGVAKIDSNSAHIDPQTEAVEDDDDDDGDDDDDSAFEARVSLKRGWEKDDGSRVPHNLEVRTLLREVCVASDISPTKCDAGLADVICVLCCPLVGLRPSDTIRAVSCLQHCGLTHLILQSSQRRKAKTSMPSWRGVAQLAGDLLCFHDRTLGAHLAWVTTTSASRRRRASSKSAERGVGRGDLGVPWLVRPGN
jgi:hypothetical protein